MSISEHIKDHTILGIKKIWKKIGDNISYKGNVVIGGIDPNNKQLKIIGTSTSDLALESSPASTSRIFFGVSGNDTVAALRYTPATDTFGWTVGNSSSRITFNPAGDIKTTGKLIHSGLTSTGDLNVGDGRYLGLSDSGARIDFESGTTYVVNIQDSILDLNTHKIVNVVDPTANQDAATKKYVDDNAGGDNPHTDLSSINKIISGGTTWLQPNLIIGSGFEWSVNNNAALHVTGTLGVSGTLIVSGTVLVIS